MNKGKSRDLMTSSKETKFKSNVLVVGGGVAGLNAALDLACQGYHVDLVEKNAEAGGLIPQLHRLYPLCSCCKLSNRLISSLQHPAITVHTQTQVSEVSGEAGNFQVSLTGKDASKQIQAGAIILSTGVETFDPSVYDTYDYSRFPNVITSVDMEWSQKPAGPHQGIPKRPSDGQSPKRVAWLQCVGSREINVCDALFCSSVCCMYALKEAVNLKEAIPDVETSIFFMDMRTHGKGYERYMNEAVEKGVRLVRSRIHNIEREGGTEDLRLGYIDEEGNKKEEIFDMVVLSVGLRPSSSMIDLTKKLGVKLTTDFFVETDNFKPTETNVAGVFVCGGAAGPRDVHQSVVESMAAVGKTAALLKGEAQESASPVFRDVTKEDPAVGVVLSLCPSKVSGFDALTEQLKSYVKELPGVAFAETLDLSNAQGFADLSKLLREKNANRLIYASCTPVMQQDLVEWALKEAGLNPTLYNFVDLRTLGTGAGELGRLKDLFRATVVGARLLEPMKMTEVPVQRSALVIGGGPAGMETALALAAQDVPVTLVEKKDKLGGHAPKVRATWKGESVQDYLAKTVRAVESHPQITVLTNAEVVAAKGFAGNFTSTVKQNGSTRDIRHGVVVLATGAHSLKPQEYGYGQSPEIYRWSDFSKKLIEDSAAFSKANCGVFIQCVGSREPQRPYCSRLCCSFAVRASIDLKTRNPDMDVYVLYREMRTFGEREAIYKEAREKGVIFIRFDVNNKPKVSVNGSSLEVTVTDPVLGREVLLKPDFISLQTAIIPADVTQLAELYKVTLDEDGFFRESPAKMRPVDGETEGVYFAGLALAPKATEEALADGWAVAGRAMRILNQKSMLIGGAVAEVNPELCAVCLTCVRTCPFSIPFISKEDGAAYIDPGLCQGCGMCVSECPGKAISFRRLSDEQIVTVSRALFQAQ